LSVVAYFKKAQKSATRQNVNPKPKTLTKKPLCAPTTRFWKLRAAKTHARAAAAAAAADDVNDDDDTLGAAYIPVVFFYASERESHAFMNQRSAPFSFFTDRFSARGERVG